MMRLPLLYSLLIASLFLTGFRWPFFGENGCKEAMELTARLDRQPDESVSRQTESQILSTCPDGAAAHFVAAIQLERVGNVDGAIAEYRRALQLEKNFPLASGNLGLLYTQKEMYDEASVELARGLSAVQNPAYHKAIGHILAERKVYPLAIYHLSEAARGLTGDAGILVDLADAYRATGQTDRALEEYRKAVSVAPGQVRPRVAIGTILMERNDLDKALAELKQAAVAAPDEREVHQLLARIYEKKGDSRQADYEKLLAGKAKATTTPPSAQVPKAAVVPHTAPSPRSAPPVSDKDLEALKAELNESPDKAAEIYEKIGNIHKAAGRDADAISAYREAAHRKSPSSDVYLNLGILYEKAGMLDEAVVAYKQAVRANIDNADAHLRLAEIRNQTGFLQEAAEQYGEFLKLKPDSPDIQLKLARILAKSKESSLALNAYGEILRRYPDNVDANREIATIYKAKGMNEKAIEHYRKVLAQQRDDLETRSALVSLYVKNKQYDEITDLLKGTVDLFPDDPNNHYKLGLIYEFRKDYENALGSYKKAVEIKPDHARSLNAIGRLYMKTGRISEAKEVLETARKADPTLEETTVLLNNIRDEFSPEPRKIKHSKGKSKKSKSKKSKTGSKKSAKTTKKKSQ